MGCNSLIRNFIFRTLIMYMPQSHVIAQDIYFPHFTFHNLLSAPYKLLVIRRVWKDKIGRRSLIICKIIYMNLTHSFHTCTPQGNSLSLPLQIQMVKSLERRGILAPLPTSISSQSLRIKDHESLDVAYKNMISSLDCCLRKVMIVPSNVLRYFLQVAFYDHPMSLRVSLYIQRIELPTN